jgi:hypothetical protein
VLNQLGKLLHSYLGKWGCKSMIAIEQSFKVY